MRRQNFSLKPEGKTALVGPGHRWKENWSY